MNDLLKLTDELDEILAEANLSVESRRLKNAAKCLQEKEFRVLVTGEYSRGKSTLINALLGEDILQTSLLRIPTVNIIRGGEKRVALASISGEMKTINPSEIAEMEGPTLVELTWAGRFPGREMEIMEMPSMSEAPDPEAFADGVEKADLVIIVIACDSLYSNTESEIYKNIIRVSGHNKPLFVANFLDRIATKDEEDVRRAAFVRLPVNKDRIFFISAREALDGTAGTQNSVEPLRIKILEEAANREEVKTHRLRFTALQALEAAHSKLETIAGQAGVRHKEAEEEIDTLQKGLKAIERLDSRLQMDLIEFRNGTRDVVQGKINNFLREVRLKLEDWEKKYSRNISADFLNAKFKEVLDDFTNNDFKPYLEKRMKEQEALLANGFKQYQHELKRLYALLPEDMPNINHNFEITIHIPELANIELEDDSPAPTSQTENFRIQNLIEVPEAMLTLIGTAIGSIIYTQFALILLPVGLGASFYLALRKRHTHTGKTSLQSFNTQIREQSGRLDIDIMEQVNSEIDKFQSQATRMLKATTEKAQNDVMVKIKSLQSELPDNENALKELARIREKLEGIS